MVEAEPAVVLDGESQRWDLVCLAPSLHETRGETVAQRLPLQPTTKRSRIPKSPQRALTKSRCRRGLLQRAWNIAADSRAAWRQERQWSSRTAAEVVLRNRC